MSDKYLRCETLTGEWWYKDMETGEDLPMYATPIERKSWQDLNNECSELNQICKQLKSQLQQKENQLKEVREYIKQLLEYKKEDYYKGVSLDYVERILDILEGNLKYE